MPVTQSRSLSRRWRVCLLVVGVLLVGLIGAVSLGKGRIVAGIEQRMTERLEARGLRAEWSAASWKLWRGGVVFHDFTLHETIDQGKRVLAVERVAVRLPPSEWISTQRRALVWRVPSSRVVVADQDGDITLEGVTARFETGRGKIRVKEAKATFRGLTVDLEGEILIRKEPPDPPPRFVMQLDAARATLAVLDFDEEGKAFKITGNFAVDASTPAFDWKASLKGRGRQVILRGVPLKEAAAEAELSSTSESVIQVGLSTEHGRVQGTTQRENWDGKPFNFEGTLSDQEGRESRFSGYQRQNVLEVPLLDGTADLWAIAEDLPMLAAEMPKAVEMKTFPPVKANGIRWAKDEGLSIDGVKTTAPGEVVLVHGGKRINVSSLTGDASLKGKKWTLKAVGGQVFGGKLSVAGAYAGGKLTSGTIKGDGLRLARIKQAMGKKGGSTPGVLAFSYKGSADPGARQFTGEGRMMLENAPVIEVPLLDQVHDLFSSILPGVERSQSGEGRFEAHFTSKGHLVDVGIFEARGGTLVVDARGQVDLKQETVSGSARGKLTGLPGIATSPLSRLLEMEVGGKLDKIQVRRLEAGSIISKAAEGTAEVIGDAIKGESRKKTDDTGQRSPRSPARWFDKWRQERR